MRRVQTKQTLKFHLLALVLALALLWYSLNPAPGTVMHEKQEPDLPDERKQNVEPRSAPAIMPITPGPSGGGAEHLFSFSEGEDNFEWPEFIDG